LDDFKSLINDGLDQAKVTIEQIEIEFSKNDIKRTQYLAHYLKGSTVTLGFRELTRLLQVIHYSIMYNESLVDTIPQLQDAYDQTANELYISDKTDIKPLVLQIIIEANPYI
jgi:HPt (histidine-containing phosphotransfer) domain-containing protein